MQVASSARHDITVGPAVKVITAFCDVLAFPGCSAAALLHKVCAEAVRAYTGSEV